MKWILIWWMITPGRAQAVHREEYSTQAACEIAGGSISVHNGAVRWHCSEE